MQEFDEYMTLCGCPGEEFPQERERFVAEYLHDFATMVLRPLEAHGPSIEAYLEHCVPDLDTVPERK